MDDGIGGVAVQVGCSPEAVRAAKGRFALAQEK
jgi:hypothetical protein